jgi:excisionase family DNA binding protein
MTESQSPLAADLLTTVEEIARYVGWPLRKTQHQIASGRLPVKRFGQTITARKSQLDRVMTPREPEAV